MSIGKHLNQMRKREGLSQTNIADELFVDQTMISKIEKNQRSMSEELVRKSVGLYDDAQYGFSAAHETAPDYISPLAIGGKAIEWHRLALEEVFKTQANEAIELFDRVSLVKPPQYVDEIEREQIEKGITELLDVQAIINSFLTNLEQEYDISVKKRMRKRVPVWKSKGWIV